MKNAELSQLFRQILRLSLVAGPGLSAGCGPDLSLYEQPACQDYTLAVSGLKPARPVDYVELRQADDVSMGAARVIAKNGTPCATATKQAACQKALADLQSQGAFYKFCFDYCARYYLAITRGDDVLAIDTPAAWREFLGQIDTTQEATLAVWAAGYSVSCSDKARGAVRTVPGGYEVVGTKGVACGPGTAVTRYVVLVDGAGTLTEVSQDILERGDPNCAIGRRPAGLRQGRMRRARTRLGRHFARSAALEAASVDAFRILFRELRAHGAPDALLLQALAAAADEVRHTATTAELAYRYQAEPATPRLVQQEPRPLAALALENEVEGCVRETFGALVAEWQARHAQDQVIAAEMAQIAADETRHAALSWQVAAWARHRLPASARRELLAARRQAVDTLLRELRTEPAPELVTLAGLPSAEQARSLAGQLAGSLWV